MNTIKISDIDKNVLQAAGDAVVGPGNFNAGAALSEPEFMNVFLMIRSQVSQFGKKITQELHMDLIDLADQYLIEEATSKIK